MKRLITLTALAISLASCSTDDNTIVDNTPEGNTPVDTIEAPQEYKMFMNQYEFQLESYTIKTKTGNGAWVQPQIANWRIPVHEGDSIYISSNGQYTPDKYTYFEYQINTVVDWYDTRNFTSTLLVYDRPLVKKFKLVLPH